MLTCVVLTMATCDVVVGVGVGAMSAWQLTCVICMPPSAQYDVMPCLRVHWVHVRTNFVCMSTATYKPKASTQASTKTAPGSPSTRAHSPSALMLHWDQSFVQRLHACLLPATIVLTSHHVHCAEAALLVHGAHQPFTLSDSASPAIPMRSHLRQAVGCDLQEGQGR